MLSANPKRLNYFFIDAADSHFSLRFLLLHFFLIILNLAATPSIHLVSPVTQPQSSSQMPQMPQPIRFGFAFF